MDKTPPSGQKVQLKGFNLSQKVALRVIEELRKLRPNYEKVIRKKKRFLRSKL